MGGGQRAHSSRDEHRRAAPSEPTFEQRWHQWQQQRAEMEGKPCAAWEADQVARHQDDLAQRQAAAVARCEQERDARLRRAMSMSASLRGTPVGSVDACRAARGGTPLPAVCADVLHPAVRTAEIRL